MRLASHLEALTLVSCSVVVKLYAAARTPKVSSEMRTSPTSLQVEVSCITAATTIALGSSHSCALLSDGKMTCWGDNYYGQLGDGTTTSSPTPVEVVGLLPPPPLPNATAVPPAPTNATTVLSPSPPPSSYATAVPPPSPPPPKPLMLTDNESSAFGYSVLTALVLSILVWI